MSTPLTEQREYIKPIADVLAEEFWKSFTRMAHQEQRTIAEEIVQEMRSKINPDDLKDFAQKLFENDELRRHLNTQTTYLYLDLHSIQGKIWNELLEDKRADLDAAIAKRGAILKSLESEKRLKRDVELANLDILKKQRKDGWDLLLYRAMALRLHVVAGIAIALLGFGGGINWGKAMLCSSTDAVCRHVRVGEKVIR
jgi:hypothetical protein